MTVGVQLWPAGPVERLSELPPPHTWVGAAPWQALGVGTCEFCDVFSGAAAGPPIAYDDGSFAVLMGRSQPTGPGYALVVPKDHIPDLQQIPRATLAPTLDMVRRVALAVTAVFGVSGTTVTQNNGAPSQSVTHLHFHVIPRHDGDGYPNVSAPEVALSDLAAQAILLGQALAPPSPPSGEIGRETVHTDYRRVPFDVEGYVRRATSGRGCFICRIARGEDDRHEIVYRDDHYIAFFNRYPTLSATRWSPL